MSKRFVPARIRAKDEPEWQLEDCAMHGDIVLSDAEKAYRRGFSQGVSITRQLIEASMSLEELHAWELALLKWRKASAEWIKGQPVIACDPPIPKLRSK